METEFYGDGQHNGGVFNAGNLNAYIYCYQNPVKYVDPNGKQIEFSKFMEYSHSPYLNVTKNRLENNRLIPQEFGLKPSSAYLLSKVTDIDYNGLMSANITFTDYKNLDGGGLTWGDSAGTKRINFNSTDPYDFDGFFTALMAHEVGHFKEASTFSNKTDYFINTGANYLESLVKNGSAYEQWHDKTPNEKRAETGSKRLSNFNTYVNKNYGKNALYKLLNNKNINENDKIIQIDKWYKSYDKSKK